jgi:hypothetical protein
MPCTYLLRIVSFKKKIKFIGAGGFFFKECYFIYLHVFFLVIIFIKNKITIDDIVNKSAIIKSMGIKIIDV